MSEFHLPPTHPLHHKQILALDYGEKFIGVALFYVNQDPYPLSYGRIENKNAAFTFKELKKILDQEGVDLIVVGIPYLLDGKKTKMSEKIESFISLLKDQFSLPIEVQDETLSTFEAESRMKNSPRYDFKVDLKQIDALAATVILEDFIRRNN